MRIDHFLNLTWELILYGMKVSMTQKTLTFQISRLAVIGEKKRRYVVNESRELERKKTYIFVLSSLNDMTLARICVANVHITKINVPIIFCISKMRVRVREYKKNY